METLRPTIRSFLASAILTICSSALAQTTLYVNGTCGNDAWSGTSMICDAPDGPKETIQAAIAAAVDGDEVVVAPGTYNALVNFIGKTILLRSADGPGVTILDGTGLNNSVVKCISGEGPETVLEGFTITGGTGDPSVLDGSTVGGGMRIQDSSPWVQDCVFIANTAHGVAPFDGSGGGVYAIGGAPSFMHCTFQSNVAERSGGAAQQKLGTATFTSCLFKANDAGDNAGGVEVGAGGIVQFVNSVFDSNRGGLTNTGFSGGLSINNTASVRVTNCTFSRNVPWAIVHERDEVDPFLVTNSIFWGDSTDQIWGVATVNHSNIRGGWNGLGGVGNTDVDPMFINPAAGDYRLQRGSPCADTANNDSVPDDILTDLDGNPRFSDDSCASDGDGESPIVDMGAYETPACRVDLTYDCTVNTQDFLVFLGLWVLQDPIVDWNGDGEVNTLDFLAYLNDWVAGC